MMSSHVIHPHDDNENPVVEQSPVLGASVQDDLVLRRSRLVIVLVVGNESRGYVPAARLLHGAGNV